MNNLLRSLKVFLFVIILILMDISIGDFLEHLYFKQKTGPSKSLTYSLTSCNEQIIILGNSRAQHHYNPEIFSDSLNMTCFNAGLDGGHSILLSHAQILAICKRYKPNIVILEFSPSSITLDQQSYEKLSILLPYYDSLKFLAPIIELRSPYEKIKFLSNIYPYNSNTISILKNSILEKSEKKIPLNGYIPINKEMDSIRYKTSFNFKDSILKPDYNKIAALDSIIKTCHVNNVKLIIINSPVFNYGLYQDKISDNNPAIQLIQKHNITYFNFESDSTFNNSASLFSDPKHLNYLGADLFSGIVAQRIKEQLSQNEHQ